MSKPPLEMIPTRFWKSLTPQEWERICDNGGELDAQLCARLWHMEDRQGEPPRRLGVLVRVSDINRLFPKKEGKERQVNANSPNSQNRLGKGGKTARKSKAGRV